MKRVLHYAPGFLVGGIESRLLDWYRNMDRSQIQFVLVKLNEIDDTENMKEYKELGGIYYNLPSFNIKSAIYFCRKIRDILINEKIDIVHVHDVNSGFFVLREAKKLGIKCRILHSRTTNFLPNEKNVFVKKILKKFTPRYANFFWACSKEAGEWGCGKKKKAEVINNGIQVENFKFDQTIRTNIRKELKIDDKIVIGYIGRLSTQKNIPYLLEIFRRILDKDSRYALLVVGDGDRTIIDDFFVNTEKLNSIILVGNKKDTWNYYMAMDIFCCPSLYEGFGTTAIEAQASGLPTIISKAFPQVVEITDFILRLDIGQNDIDKWVDIILSNKLERFSDIGIEKVIKSGYSAKDVSKYIYDFYLRNG